MIKMKGEESEVAIHNSPLIIFSFNVCWLPFTLAIRPQGVKGLPGSPVQPLNEGWG